MVIYFMVIYFNDIITKQISAKPSSQSEMTR